MNTLRLALPARLRCSRLQSFALRSVPVCALLIASGTAARAATVTWDGGAWSAGTGGNGTEWGTAANWRPDTVPADGDSVQFNAANLVTSASGTTTLDSNTVVMGNQTTGTLQVGQGISGTGIPAGSYITSIVNSTTVTISQNATASASNVSITVSNVGGLASSPVINLGADRIIDTMGLANSNTFTIGSAADISSGNDLTLTNVARTNNIAMTIAANVNLAPNITGKSTWRDSSNGTTTVTGAVGSTGSVILNKSGSTGSVVMNGANTFTGSVLVDAGVLSFGGTNVYTGSTTASGGTMTVNFNAGAAATPTTDIINSSSALILGGVRGGGTLTVNGKNAANSVNSQTFNGTTLNAGASTLNIVNGISSGKTLVSLGAITRNTGSTVNFVQPTVNTTINAQNGYVASTANDVSGILGGYATVGGTDWATNNGTNIVAYTGYVTLSGATPDIVDSTTTNVSITSGSTGAIGQVSGTTTVNTIRVNDATARTITVGAGNTLRLGAVGGVLSTGTNGLTIGASGNAGTLTAGGADNTAGELILNNSTALTINSAVADNGTGAVVLTKSGAGTLTLNGTNTYTGGTFVNAGTLALVAGSTNPLANTGAITVTGGTLALGTGTNQTTTGAIILAGGTISGGTLTNNGSALDVRNGTISAVLAGSGGITKTTAGTLTLANTVANTFTGTTTITEGSLVAASSASVIGVSGNLVLGSASGGNAASYTVGTNNVGWATGKTLTVYSNGSVNFGNGAQNITSAAIINIIGGSVTGSQIYTQAGASFNLTGGTLTGSFFAAGAAYNVLASSSTSTIGVGTSSGSQTFNVADGASVTDLAYTGNLGGANNLTKTGAGYMLASGSSGYTGNTTISGGTLAVTTLANGGSSSAIGASANTASTLLLGNGTTLEYTGTGHSTDRLFTVNGSAAGHSATLNASGTGAANFTNSGNLAWGTTNQTRTLKLGGTSTADNTLSALIGNNGTGAVSLTKQDAGKWIITGANTYTGETTINGGSLIVNGSLASGSAVAVNSGGTLGGSGTIGGSVTVNSGGFLAPGNSPGVLTVGSLNLVAGSTTSLEIAGTVRGTSYDGINVTTTSGLTYGGALSLSFTSTLTNNDSLDLFSFTGTAGGNFTSVVSTGIYAGTWTSGSGVWTFTGNDQLLTFDLASGDLTVAASMIPEPSTFALFGGMIALSIACGRSRRRV